MVPATPSGLRSLTPWPRNDLAQCRERHPAADHPEAKRPYWSVDEARAFLESADANNDPLYAAYVLVLVLGLRRGEALGLAGMTSIWISGRSASPGSYSVPAANCSTVKPRRRVPRRLFPCPTSAWLRSNCAPGAKPRSA